VDSVPVQNALFYSLLAPSSLSSIGVCLEGFVSFFYLFPLLSFLCQFLFFYDFLSSRSLCLPVSAELLTNTH
jgi:hypothetical protein